MKAHLWYGWDNAEFPAPFRTWISIICTNEEGLTLDTWYVLNFYMDSYVYSQLTQLGNSVRGQHETGRAGKLTLYWYCILSCHWHSQATLSEASMKLVQLVNWHCAHKLDFCFLTNSGHLVTITAGGGWSLSYTLIQTDLVFATLWMLCRCVSYCTV